MGIKHRKISMRFLALTSPAYLGCFVLLLLIRAQDYDSFSDKQLLISVIHVFGLQVGHWLILHLKKEVSRNYMRMMLWFMVYNNILLFSYWILILENARSFIYMLAPMSVIALFFIASMKQVLFHNLLLAVSLAISAAIHVVNSNQPIDSAGLDWIYIMTFFIVSIWLSNLSELYSNNREKLRNLILSEKSSKRALEYTLKQLEHAHTQLEKVSYTDALTNIHNRRYFNEAIEQVWKQAIINKKPLSLLMIDVDLFKNFNDQYGHQVGDKCLTEVAEIISSSLGRKGDEVCRYGDEEFVTILPATSDYAATSVAERIRIAISEHKISCESETFDVTVSIGIATLSEEYVIENIDVLIRLADEALYEAKEKGRNRTIHSAK